MRTLQPPTQGPDALAAGGSATSRDDQDWFGGHLTTCISFGSMQMDAAVSVRC